MSLTPTQKALVQSSFEKVVPIADVAADLFYRRLFQLDPSLRALFRHDMTEQGRMLMQTLTIAVRSLDRLDSLVPALHELGKRHVGYGVPVESYTTVGEALLWTLEQGLGPDFTPDVREAWAHTYSILATTAIEGAHMVEREAEMA